MFNNIAFQQIVKETEAHHAKLVVVTKTQPIEVIETLYEARHRLFGENRVPELIEKQEQLPNDIQWHMIGHLQRNKVKSIAPFISMIHSIDSWRLLKEVNKQAKKNNRMIDCLLQIHIADEDSKFGLTSTELNEIVAHPSFPELTHVRICGLMGMATFTDDQEKIKNEFLQLATLFDTIKSSHFASDVSFCEKSMGMSGDYQLALNCGSTMVRVGSLIFSKS